MCWVHVNAIRSRSYISNCPIPINTRLWRKKESWSLIFQKQNVVHRMLYDLAHALQWYHILPLILIPPDSQGDSPRAELLLGKYKSCQKQFDKAGCHLPDPSPETQPQTGPSSFRQSHLHPRKLAAHYKGLVRVCLATSGSNFVLLNISLNLPGVPSRFIIFLTLLDLLCHFHKEQKQLRIRKYYLDICWRNCLHCSFFIF